MGQDILTLVKVRLHMTVKFSVSPWAVLETLYLTCNHLQQLTSEGNDNTVQSQLEITICVCEGNAFLRARGILSTLGSAIAASSLRETAEMANQMMRTFKETMKFVSLYVGLGQQDGNVIFQYINC
jgi:hypothetical protein